MLPKAMPSVGEVWYIDFDPQVGTEQAGLRPGLVISGDGYNTLRNGLHIIVPITTTDRGLTFHVRMDPPEGGVTKASYVMCDQVKAQSIRRFRNRRGTVEGDTLRRIQEIVALFIER